MKEVARYAIQDIVERVSVCQDQQLAILSAKACIDKNRNLVCVLIVCIVWRELKVPFEDTGVGIEGDGAI